MANPTPVGAPATGGGLEGVTGPGGVIGAVTGPSAAWALGRGNWFDCAPNGAALTLSIDGTNTPYRTLVDYKETHQNAIVDPNIDKLYKLGFNHVCFAVDDLDAEVAKLTAAGVKLRNEVMNFHNRKLVFVRGPEDITVELAEWR